MWVLGEHEGEDGREGLVLKELQNGQLACLHACVGLLWGLCVERFLQRGAFVDDHAEVIRHLFQAKEILGCMLLTWHNIQYYEDLMRDIRRAIREDRLEDFAKGDFA